MSIGNVGNNIVLIYIYGVRRVLDLTSDYLPK